MPALAAEQSCSVTLGFNIFANAPAKLHRPSVLCAFCFLRLVTHFHLGKIQRETLIIDPRLTPKLLKLKQATGSLPKRISATEIQASTASHIRDAMAATLGLGSSAMSGNINTLAIGIYEEVMP